MSDFHHSLPHRALLTGSVMMATMMQALDVSIANVALPYMRGSLSASESEITWVLTSYVIAAAIMTAPVGWLAVRFGRRRLFIGCLSGFTLASMLCGAAATLDQIVLFRLLQGMCGAALVPLSQATMLDIYPFSKRAFAMAIFSSGVMAGPILGPELGGYLTEAYNWRYVFYVNLPIGILAVSGLALFMPNAPRRPDLRFDWLGFVVLGIGIGAFQLMLDRGQELGWFGSREIVLEATLAGLGFFLFLVHMLTAPKPFLPVAMFKDRNFSASMLVLLCTTSVMLSTTALLAPYLETLANYPVQAAGFALSPRGIGTMTAMFFASWLSKYVDQRKIMAAGLMLLGLMLHAISFWRPDVSERDMMLTLIGQGFSVGLIFNPLTVIAFVTLPARFRGDATALQALTRNTGQAIGISVTTFMLARREQISHADIAARITPFDRLLHGNGRLARLYDPGTPHGAALLNAAINRQAEIIAYNNVFHAMMFVVAPALVLLLLLRRPPARQPAE
ncbi:MAG: DHA2 family efflux MFS transporter permease subunit [Rhodospirillales bacterium]|nr:DHA2 family efflux MFS transporter permease subunit [Rhodospirillales bacterium]